MRIIVCIKQVPDPEGPRSSFEINEASRRVEPKGIPPVLSLFDENALEAALRLKDASPADTKLTVLSVGSRLSNAVLQKALAVGADDLVKVEDDMLDPGGADSFVTASAIAAALGKIGSFDLVMVGRQAADWNAGQVGAGVAGILGLPYVSLARGVRVQDGHVLVDRVLVNGSETVRAPMPAVIMVSNEVGMMRYPTMIQRREAKGKAVTAWNAADAGMGSVPARRVSIHALAKPEVRRSTCTIIRWETPEEAGRKFVQCMKDAGVM